MKNALSFAPESWRHALANEVLGLAVALSVLGNAGMASLIFLFAIQPPSATKLATPQKDTRFEDNTEAVAANPTPINTVVRAEAPSPQANACRAATNAEKKWVSSTVTAFSNTVHSVPLASVVKRSAKVILALGRINCVPCERQTAFLLELARANEDVTVAELLLEDDSFVSKSQRLVQLQQQGLPVYAWADGSRKINQVPITWVFDNGILKTVCEGSLVVPSEEGKALRNVLIGQPSE